MNLSDIDRKLVGLLQAEVPLTKHPYADIASGLGINEEEVMMQISQLKKAGIIRQISPVLAPASLGYRTTLVAMKVAAGEMNKAAQLVMKHPGISHGYERDYYINLWFTLATSTSDEIEAELKRLAESIKAEVFFTLPAVRLFKLRAHFALDGNGQTKTIDNHNIQILQQEVRLSSMDRLVVNTLQQDLPLAPQPFAQMAEQLGMDEGKFLFRCRSLIKRGIMRRFSAAVNHRKAGFTANAMTCWTVPSEKIETAGRKLALLQTVSHCYERKTNPIWSHNLFAMIHGHTREACKEVADKVSAETSLTTPVMLFSTREFKKTRIKYLV
jgi:DNA-binding Lrp family transcriptional regulator